MTNAIVMTVMLSTNWDGFIDLTPAPVPKGATNFHWNRVEHAEVYRYVTFHTMDGTNRIHWGYTTPIKAGTISRTNDVLGPIVWSP